MESEKQAQPDPGELPEDPERSAGEAAGGAEEDEGGRKPPPEDLESDPAYDPDDPVKGIKGG